MDKAQIKKFSQYARSILIPEMQQTISIWKKASIVPGGVQIGNHSYNDSISLKYSSAVTSLKKQIDKKGEKVLAEEAAYIWFNRLVALRFMEINKYLPTKSSLFVSDDNTGIPEIVKNIANEWDNCGCDKNAIDEYIGRSDINSIQELYSIILVSICNKLSEHYGFMFSKIDDWTALLFPRAILNTSHILRDKTNGMLNIVDEDWKEVEIIGWIYQYYISERKDDLMYASKKDNQKFGKSEIGAVTQIFTPKWIVEYMVQNTVGRTWLQNYSNLELQKKWEFYIKGESDTIIKINSPKELTLLDPACGSGHILVVGFEVLFEIYKAAGYMDEDIPELIIKNNLYGFEIDERAHQLACFAVLMKSKQYDKNIEKKVDIGNNVICIGENNNFDKIDEVKYPNLKFFVELWNNGKVYGSLMKMDEVEIDKEKILCEYEKFKKEQGLFVDTIIGEGELKDFLHQYDLMHNQYVCVVANPPYMGGGNMDDVLKKFILNKYNDYRADLFSAFVSRNIGYCPHYGKLGFMTPNVWMFLTSYEKLRKYLIDNVTISSLVQLAKGSFFSEATVDICTFVIDNYHGNSGTYINLSDFKGAELQAPKTLEAINSSICSYKYFINQSNLKRIPGWPIAYRVSENIYTMFENNKKLSDIGEPKVGLQTGNNDKYTRLWYEVSFVETSLKSSNGKRYPFYKGGDFRKWFGNLFYLVNRGENGKQIRQDKGSVVRNEKYYFKESISCGAITSSVNSYRYYPKGGIFDVNFRSMFFENLNYYMLGLLNSKVCVYLGKILSQTMALNINDILRFPVIVDKNNEKIIGTIVEENIGNEKQDRDSFELSRDFQKHPLVENSGLTLEDSFSNRDIKTKIRFNQLKKKESELNQIFNQIYNLQNEIDSFIGDNDITVRLANRNKDTQSLLSYIIGCMMGRYSLDHEGLVYAGGEFDKSKYKTFKADDDGIIPILDRDYSDDDVVERTKEFVKKVWGGNTLDENLNWIAESLDPESNKTADQVIRDYYNKEFYDNHCQIYQKRPIYWLFVSNPAKPKDSAFKALVYIHRYSSSTIQDLRRNYVQMYQQKLLEERARIENNNDKTSQKRVAEIDKMNAELTAYSNKLKDFAETHTGEIDLDDGVKVNYGMFMDAGIVAKIKL